MSTRRKRARLNMVAALTIVSCGISVGAVVIPPPPDVGPSPVLRYASELAGPSATLIVWVESLDAGTGHVLVNGVDSATAVGPFIFDWGDGSIDSGWFAMPHVYADRTRNYVVTVTAHYAGGASDEKACVVQFAVPTISPRPLPELLRVTMPTHSPALQTRLYALPPTLSGFPLSVVGNAARNVSEYTLSAAAWIQYELANGDVLLPDGAFHQLVLRDSTVSHMYSLWYSSPVALVSGDASFSGSTEYSSLFHEMGHNVTLNSPAAYHLGGRIDGPANALVSESLAQIFQHVTAYELVNNASEYGLDEALARTIWESALSSFRGLRRGYETYVQNGCPFASWNNPLTPPDETLGSFMSVAFVFLSEVEQRGGSYRESVKRMMSLLQTFDAGLEQRYSRNANSPEAEAFRATFVVAAVSFGVGADLRATFRALNFPIDDVVYDDLTARIAVDLPVCFDMESGHAWTTTGLWHRTSRRSFSPDISLWFGDAATGTYGPGTPVGPMALTPEARPAAGQKAAASVGGTLTSPPIAISGRTAIELSFWHWRDVEYHALGGYDKTCVQVSYDRGTWHSVWSLDSRTPSARMWQRVAIDLSVPPGASAMQVRFLFDSVDAYFNDYEGWFIDDVQVSQGSVAQVADVVFTPPPGRYDEPVLVTLACSTPGATIHYSTDGTDPTASSATYAAPILIATPTRIRARATKPGLAHGNTVTADYSIQTAIWYDDMESGQAWTSTGLWVRTSRRSHSPGNSLWFGSEATGTYGSGVMAPSALSAETRAYGTSKAFGGSIGILTSPSIPVAGGAVIECSFWHWREVEHYAPGSYDKTYVQVRYGSGSWTTVWGLDSKTPSAKTWQHVVLSSGVPPGASAMQVRFVFDTVDGFFNEYEGWFVDDVEIAYSQNPSILSSASDQREGVVVSCSPNPVRDVHTAWFAAKNASVESMRVLVFDLAGTLVFTAEEPGDEISWHTDNLEGEYLANGIYLYQVWVLVRGEWLLAERAGKIAVLR